MCVWSGLMHSCKSDKLMSDLSGWRENVHEPTSSCSPPILSDRSHDGKYCLA